MLLVVLLVAAAVGAALTGAEIRPGDRGPGGRRPMGPPARRGRGRPRGRGHGRGARPRRHRPCRHRPADRVRAGRVRAGRARAGSGPRRTPGRAVGVPRAYGPALRLVCAASALWALAALARLVLGYAAATGQSLQQPDLGTQLVSFVTQVDAGRWAAAAVALAALTATLAAGTARLSTARLLVVPAVAALGAEVLAAHAGSGGLSGPAHRSARAQSRSSGCTSREWRCG